MNFISISDKMTLISENYRQNGVHYFFDLLKKASKTESLNLFYVRKYRNLVVYQRNIELYKVNKKLQPFIDQFIIEIQ
jgi:hypothetical protein